MSNNALARSRLSIRSIRDDNATTPLPCTLGRGLRRYAGQAAAANDGEATLNFTLGQSVRSNRAKQKQADKEFFADLLSSAVTKRDAKAYISRLKSDVKPQNTSRASKNQSLPRVNLFGRSRAVETSPVFAQGADVLRSQPEESERPHIALVKISDIENVSDDALRGIAQTLAQLLRLSMAPIVVVEPPIVEPVQNWKSLVMDQADRLVAAIDDVTDTGARKLADILSLSADEHASLLLPGLLFRPILNGRIPVILPIAYSQLSHRAIPISADAAVLALTEGLTAPGRGNNDAAQSTHLRNNVRASLDRIIVIDPTGPIPSTKSLDEKHVFINMEQEYHSLQEELRSSTDPKVSPRHASNLRMLRRALQMLPASASGLITTPQEAANSRSAKQPERITSVGTRRQKNPLIHNLLTDKPAYSSSLPSGRLGLSPESASGSTFVKKGMPLTILPNPAAQEWTADKQPWIKLTDSRIDLKRLVYLINDSFDRELDIDAYLERVNCRMAGVIIAGEYEGGAILTWETPPGVDESDRSRLVPYLDKFAVLKSSQGAGGVADILFNAMVRTCFPNGVCWRSRKTNPVNKWYFERSLGTWKIPDMNWTMFWTTPGVGENDQTFLDYQAVCRSVKPTWADDKKVED